MHPDFPGLILFISFNKYQKYGVQACDGVAKVHVGNRGDIGNPRRTVYRT